VWRKFFRVIEARPAIAAYVRAVKISLRIFSSTLFYATTSQNADSLGVLRLFPNVRTFYLEGGSGVYPHPRVLGNWFQLPRALAGEIVSLMEKDVLTTISISGFEYFPVRALSCSTALERLQLHDVSFSYAETSDWAGPVGSLTRLRIVKVSTSSLIHFPTTQPRILANRRFHPTWLILQMPITLAKLDDWQGLLDIVGGSLLELKYSVDCTCSFLS
jgi:hypothetical protein